MAVQDFPVTEAQLTGLFVESIFFGIHIVSLGYCMHTLFKTQGRGKGLHSVNWTMVAVSLTLFSIATFDVVVGFYHDLKAFVFLTGQGGASAEFNNISEWANISKSVTVVVQTMIGDAMLIYRCWVVYNRSWLAIALSMSLWLGCFAMAVWVIELEVTLHSKILVNAKQLQPAGTSFWALTIVINIVTTGLLVWRIWKVENNNRRHRIIDATSSSGRLRKSHLRRVVWIVIESGLLYTVTALISFITFIIGSNGVYVITDAETHIVGIAFNLIIIRASRIRDGAEGSTVRYTAGSGRTVPLQMVNPRSHIATTASEQKTEVHVVMTQNSLHDFDKMDRETA